MATVKLTGVYKVFGKDFVAVSDFNLDIQDKEFIVFVGPSGCGKSTTLRMVAGLEDITAGTVEIDGRVVNDLPPKDRGIAMVFQNYALYPHLTVFENMAFSLRLAKVRNDEIYDRVLGAAKILGITSLLTRKPRALSGGQRQRVAIGRAMVRDSKVFLMDEPLSNLDAKLRNQMRAELILLRKKIDTTFIYVTHDQTEAMTLGDRIVVMKDGVIQQVGTPSEVFNLPSNLFVAEFIGAPKMNTVSANLTQEGGKYFVDPYGYRLEVDGERAKDLKSCGVSPGQITLGVRPEHVTLTGKDDPRGIPCSVAVNEMMGSEIHLHVTVKPKDGSGRAENRPGDTPERVDEEEFIVRIPTMSLSEANQEALGIGKEVFIAFSGRVMHFFDAGTGRNLLGENADGQKK